MSRYLTSREVIGEKTSYRDAVALKINSIIFNNKISTTIYVHTCCCCSDIMSTSVPVAVLRFAKSRLARSWPLLPAAALLAAEDWSSLSKSRVEEGFSLKSRKGFDAVKNAVTIIRVTSLKLLLAYSLCAIYACKDLQSCQCIVILPMLFLRGIEW